MIIVFGMIGGLVAAVVVEGLVLVALGVHIKAQGDMLVQAKADILEAGRDAAHAVQSANDSHARLVSHRTFFGNLAADIAQVYGTAQASISRADAAAATAFDAKRYADKSLAYVSDLAREVHAINAVSNARFNVLSDRVDVIADGAQDQAEELAHDVAFGLRLAAANIDGDYSGFAEADQVGEDSDGPCTCGHCQVEAQADGPNSYLAPDETTGPIICG